MAFKFKRALMAFAAIVAGFAGAAVAATPAQAWVVCSPPPEQNQAQYVSFWAGQGKCGEYRTGILQPDASSGAFCVKMSTAGLNNWGGAAANRTYGWKATLFERDNCGGPTKLLINPGSYANDLYPSGLYFAVSSIQFVK
jgi:hypothetical protein